MTVECKILIRRRKKHFCLYHFHAIFFFETLKYPLGHLGPRTTRPRTTLPVSPDYSDRVTGPLGSRLLNSDRANETRQLGPLF